MSASLTHEGLPPGIARPDLLKLVEDLGKKGLGVSSTALRILHHYIWRSRDSDYKAGRICAVWERVGHTAEKLALCPRAVNEAERELERKGLLTRTTGGNGARSGMRRGDVILWAAGINLGPLISRYAELKACREAQRLHQQAVMECRADIRRIRRSIRDCQRLDLSERSETILPAGRTSTIADLGRLEGIKAALEAVLSELEGEPRRQKTSDPSEENCRPNILTEDSPQPCSGVRDGAVTPEAALALASPAYREMVRMRGDATWPNLIEASRQSASLLGISQATWGRACQQIGRERAAICILIVERNAQLNRGHPYLARHPAKCVAGMLRSAAGNGFNLSGLLHSVAGDVTCAGDREADRKPIEDVPAGPADARAIGGLFASILQRSAGATGGRP